MYLNKLDKITRGDASPSEARRILKTIFTEEGGERQKIVRAAYDTLLRVTWQTVHDRRHDAKVQEWAELMASFAAFIREDNNEYSYKSKALQDLLSVSMAAAHFNSAERIIERQHVKDILLMLANAPNHCLDRKVIRSRMGLLQANMSRILNLIVSSNLIERVAEGRSYRFRLTAFGRVKAEDLAARARRAETKAQKQEYQSNNKGLPTPIVKTPPAKTTSEEIGLRSIIRHIATSYVLKDNNIRISQLNINNEKLKSICIDQRLNTEGWNIVPALTSYDEHWLNSVTREDPAKKWENALLLHYMGPTNTNTKSDNTKYQIKSRIPTRHHAAEGA